MKRTALLSLVILLVLTGTLIYEGCKKSDSGPTEPGQSSILANGTMAPLSRTQAQGTLFVNDADGNAVIGLTSSNIAVRLRWGTALVAVTDSLAGQAVLQTVSASGRSIAVAMTMDYSGSMYAGAYDSTAKKYVRIVSMESAVKTFVNAMGTTDKMEIIKFGSHDQVNVIQAFTSSKSLLLRAADTLSGSRGNTALYGSIVQSILDGCGQSSTSYARAVVAFTDGGENDSYVTRDSLFRASRRNGIPVYTVGLLDSMYHTTPAGGYSEEKDLVQIADSTGGFYFYAPNGTQLTQIYQRISGQLSNAYQVTIIWPSAGLPATGTAVTVVITVNYGGLVATFTRQYTMP
jgi:hypothetical protein